MYLTFSASPLSVTEEYTCSTPGVAGEANRQRKEICWFHDEEIDPQTKQKLLPHYIYIYIYIYIYSFKKMLLQ